MTRKANDNPPRLDPGARRDLVEMWVSLLACDWNSLAVVPADAGVTVGDVVESLEEAGPRATSVQRLDARGLEIAEAKRLAGRLDTGADAGSRTIVLVDSLIRSLAGVHLVQEVDAVLLVVRLGSVDDSSLATTVSMVGPSRILGTVTTPAVHRR